MYVRVSAYLRPFFPHNFLYYGDRKIKKGTRLNSLTSQSRGNSSMSMKSETGETYLSSYRYCVFSALIFCKVMCILFECDPSPGQRRATTSQAS
jgi:hypothetical protein